MVYIAYKLTEEKYTIPSTGVGVSIKDDKYWLTLGGVWEKIDEKPIIFNSLIESINWLSS